jgi:hypothetical protein
VTSELHADRELTGDSAFSSTAWLEQLTAEAYEAGRKIAARKDPEYGYERKWPDVCLASQAGFRAMVRFIVKRTRSNGLSACGKGEKSR